MNPSLIIRLDISSKLLLVGDKTAIRARLKALACAAIDQSEADIDRLIERARLGVFS